MNIAFLIGNGFDLNLGLKTSYGDFYNYYCKKPSPTQVIKQFKTDINNTDYDWSDLELALGRYTREFGDNEDAFIALLDDIQDSLAEYLDLQASKLAVTRESSRQFKSDLANIDKYLTAADAEKFQELHNAFIDVDNKIDIIVFNYTNTVERLLDWKGIPIPIEGTTTVINSVEHIHGTTNSNMILGVNDESQIKNASFKSSPNILGALKKPEMNINTETLRDERCKKIIENADLICVFGMSLGATDKYWWRVVVGHLKNYVSCAAIFTKTQQVSQRRMYRAGQKRRESKQKLLSYSILSEEDKEIILSHTFANINSELFGNLGVGIMDDDSLAFYEEFIKKSAGKSADSTKTKDKSA